jgi:hypothetical protein
MVRANQVSLRCFFTATEESAVWLQEQSKVVGMSQAEFLRLLIHSSMMRAKAGDKNVITL